MLDQETTSISRALRLPALFKARRTIVLLAALGAIALGVLAPAAPSAAQVLVPAQTWFVPLPEGNVRTSLKELYSGVGSTFNSVISIVGTDENIIIVYDHWEDGYEADITNPTQGSTEIWGDNNPGNGSPPAPYSGDLIDAGDIIILRNKVNLPRNPGTIKFDGRDKFVSSKAVAVTRAEWADNPGTVLAGAVEVYATRDFATSFESPVGEDVLSTEQFEYVGMHIMASENGTSVDVNVDASGGPDQSATLNQGETLLINGGVMAGATVAASKPVQVQLITGDIGTRYESRWFTLYNRDSWSDSYFTPAGTAGSQETLVFVYNPHASSITVNHDTLAGSGSFNVGAGNTFEFEMPADSGGRFSTPGGEPFFAISTVSSDPSTRNNIHDWGFSLVPESALTPKAVIGWGPGSGDGTQNGSPVWVTAATGGTRVYVDFDGDPTTGTSGPDPNGNSYDVDFVLAAFESRKVFDTSGDKDQTGMRLYTVDGSLITAAWGQDPSVAGPGNPYLDMGTTVLPLPSIVAAKDAGLGVDGNGNQLFDPGDVIEYTLTVVNNGVVDALGVEVSDIVPANTTYVDGTTTLDGTPLPDDGSGATTFPLDEGGLNIGNVLVGQSVDIVYQMRIDNPFPPNVDEIVNEADVSASGDTITVDVVITVQQPTNTACALEFSDAGGIDVGSYEENDSVCVKITDGDKNVQAGVADTVDVLVRNPDTGDRETLTLTESPTDSGVFVGCVPSSSTSGSPVENGTLFAQAGNTLTAEYTDPEFGDVCSDSVPIIAPSLVKTLYLSDPGQSLDRVDPSAVPIDNTTSVVGFGVPSTYRDEFAAVAYTGTNGTRNWSITPWQESYNFAGPPNPDMDPAAGTMRVVADPLAVNGNSLLIDGGPISNPDKDMRRPVDLSDAGAAQLDFDFRRVNFESNDEVQLEISYDGGGTWFGPDGTNSGPAGGTFALTGSDATWMSASYDLDAAELPSADVIVRFRTTDGMSTPPDEFYVDNVEISFTSQEVTFVQAPLMAGPFVIPAGAAVGATVFINATSGTPGAFLNATAEISDGTTTIVSLSPAAVTPVGGSIYQLDWSGVAGSTITVTAGSAIELKLTDNDAVVDFEVHYDSDSRRSRIDLGTSTVISVDDLGVYDGAFPGGVELGGASTGDTAYVRLMVSDPFGAYDITDVDLVIDDACAGSLNVTLDDGDVVSTGAGFKIYELEWLVPNCAGDYTITTTANEGSEGITDVAAIDPFPVTLQDLGASSRVQFIDTSDVPTEIYDPNETVCLEVSDADQNLDPGAAETVTVTLTSPTGDVETVVLTETGNDTGVFRACIPASDSGGTTPGDGTINAPPGVVLDVDYVDPDDPDDRDSDQAVIDTVPPDVAVLKQLEDPPGGATTVGSKVIFSLYVANPGPTTLDTVSLFDQFDNSCLAFDTASVMPDVTGATSLIWDDVGPLAPGQGRSILVTYDAIATCNPGTNLVTATAVDSGATTVDDGPSIATVIISDPGLSMSKTLVDPAGGTAEVGDPVQFEIRITNTGSTEISTLPALDVTSPSCLSFDGATPTESSAGGGTVFWNDLGPLPVGNTIVLTVDFIAASECGPTNNTASVEGAKDADGTDVPPIDDVATVDIVASSIGDRVWNDLNGDGVQDPGEPGIPGVVVNLTLPDLSVVQTTTGADGLYLFEDLHSGSYSVSLDPDTVPVGSVLTGGTDPVAVSLGIDEDFDTADFGLAPGASIGDRITVDTDGDGVPDVGEPGLPGIDVTLIDVGPDGNPGTPDDIPGPTTTTDTDGGFLFTGVPPGTYFVDVDDPDLPPDLDPAPGYSDPTPPVTVDPGDMATDVDIHYAPADPATGAIGNYVWNDADGDGLQDPGESGIGGVTVDLLDAGGAVIASTTTDANGEYWFTDLPPGGYSVDVTDTSGVLAGFSPTSGPHTSEDPTPPISLAAGEVFTAADFGYEPPPGTTGTIEDRVYRDDDGDGSPDPGEPGIPGVTVSLLDPGGEVIATTTTDPDGDFSFPGLPPGPYTVLIGDTDNVLDGDLPTTPPAATRSLPVIVPGPGPVSGESFGFTPVGEVGDTVFSDANGNGVQDPGEPGIDGVIVELWLDSDMNGLFDSTKDTLVDTTVTDAAGFYLFQGAADATYFASVDNGQAALVPYSPTTVDQQTLANSAGTQINAQLDLTGGPLSFLDADFGYQQPALADVSGSVFEDPDADGVDDGPIDPPIEGVTVELIDPGPDGIPNTPDDTVVAETTTDPNGDYVFPDVPPGDYVIVVTDDGGLLADHDPTGPPDVLPITVGGADVPDLDLGYVRDPETARLGDQVWFDADRDGVQDAGEPGIGGVDLTLFDAGPDGLPGGGDDSPVATTTSDPNGNYTFAGLPAGTYYVDVDAGSLPAGLAPSIGTTDPSSPVPLAAGETRDDVDFGYAPTDPATGAIGDTVFYDANGNGVQDPGEPGIGGVTVVVDGPGGPYPAVTDPDGSWLVSGLPPGDYTVTPDPGTLPGAFDPAPTNGDPSRIVHLPPGQDVLYTDFGYDAPGGPAPLGTIGDTVFLDQDGDGTQDPGEPGIPGVTLSLVDDGTGDVVATTVTGPDGSYDFPGLEPGTYTVDITDVDGLLDGLNLSSPIGPTQAIPLAGDYDLADFAFAPPAGTIGDRIWHDQSGDGTRDVGEPGLEGVTVDLWADTNGNGTIEPGTDNKLGSETTDVDGRYAFTGLPAGDYIVDVTDTAGVLAGMALTSGTTGVDDESQSDPYAVSLTGGTPSDLTADFGYEPAGPPREISGTVFVDVDIDAIDDPVLDPPAEGVPVLLYKDLDGDGVLDPEDPLVDQTLSDPSGDYSFPGQPDGDYLVVPDATDTPFEGFFQSTQPGPGGPQPVLVAGGDVPDQDVGLYARTTIGDRVWRDDNGDGVQDGGEPGMVGVTVDLYAPGLDGTLGTPDDILVDTLVTDADGLYDFNVGFGGDYRVDVVDTTVPLTWLSTTLNDPEDVNVPTGQDYSDADFGYVPGADIGDKVWLDSDGDGIPDPGEPGLPNVDVLLIDPGPDSTPGTPDDIPVDSTTTDLNGNYLFPDQYPGTYFIDVDDGDLPPDLVPSPGSSDPTAPFTVGPDEMYDDADLGFVPVPPTAVIGDRVWRDEDGDGVQDPGEAGIENVTVDLIDPGPDGLLGTGDDTVLDTQTTGPAGEYLFTGVPAGTYRVDVTDTFGELGGHTLTVGPQSSSDPTAPLTVAPGDVVDTADFGYDSPPGLTYPIEDRLYRDDNGNGVQDPGEPGLPGVTVSLLDDNGDVVATTTSGPVGFVSFPGVPNGDYTILVTDVGDELSDLTPTTTPADDGELPVTVSGAPVSDVSFGYRAPGAIGDRLWSDANGDGVQDPGEPGLGGVTVELLDGGSPVDSTVTAPDGSYLFEGVTPGLYTVRVDTAPLGGYTQTGDPDATLDDETDVLLGPGEGFLDADFGYRNPTLGDVTGTVFDDPDQDGAQDPGEPGIPGVTVILVDPGPDGLPGTPDDEPVAETTTDPSGNYDFPDLPDGPYAVIITDDDGLLDGADPSGPSVGEVTVAGGDPPPTDFGYAPVPETGSIGDLVWSDTNRDGVPDPAEPGLGGVKLTLVEAGPDGALGTGDDVDVAMTTSDPDGGYLFDGLPAGSYQVEVDDTTLPAGLAPTPGTTDPSPQIDLAAGETDLEVDFGYAPIDPGTGTIGDTVWSDDDGDGVQDPGEPGIGGVDLVVIGPGGTFPVTTDPDGTWEVSGLPPGEYEVTVLTGTLPAGFDPNPTNGPDQLTFNLPLGVDLLYADFGFDPLPGNDGSIGDTVFQDLDGDGVQDPGEPGIPGVTVVLYDGGGDPVAGTTTGPDGNFDFVGLPPDSYTVDVTDVDNVLDGLNLTAGTDPTAPIALGPGQDYNDADFPYGPPPGFVGDRVFLDESGNGGRDAGEPGIEGVTVDLWRDVNGNGVLDVATDDFIGTETTDVNGSYLFGGLPNGSYLVDVTDTDGVLAGMNLTSGAAGVNDQSQSDPYAVELTPGAPSDGTADFGYVGADPRDVLGTVFLDVDINALLDPGQDPLVEGVPVVLYRDLDGDGVLDPEDPQISETLSDPNGDFVFNGIPDGKYIIDVEGDGTPVEDLLQSTQDPTNGVQPVMVAGGPAPDNDFGFYGPTIIGDRVWRDDNADTVQQPGEIGIEGVTVELCLAGPDGTLDTPDDILVDSQITDANGLYTFTVGTAGDYLIKVDESTLLPTSLVITTDNNPLPVTVIDGEVFRDGDFGYTPGASIGDTVLRDLDGDGVQDVGEPGIPNVDVLLRAPGLDGDCGTGDDPILGTTTTDSDGRYLFTGLKPGTYCTDVVDGTLPPGLTTAPLRPDPTPDITVGPGELRDDADFYFTLADPNTALIGDYVWSDADGDGIQDPGEPGIGGVTVDLVAPGPDGVLGTGDDVVVDSQTTLDDGTYQFLGVPPGEYLVDVTDTGGVLAGYTLHDGPQSNPDPTLPLTVLPGQQYIDADFGYENPGLATISDVVWDDTNGNGVRDPGEEGIPDVTVHLVDDDGDIIATTTTDPDGQFDFPGVENGNYDVVLNDTNNVLPPYVPTTPESADGEHPVSVAGGDVSDVSFGFRRPGLVGDRVWSDADGDGDQDPGELGISGVTVELRDLPGTSVLDTQITDATGLYLFESVPAGGYTVRVSAASLPPGYSQTGDPDAILDDQAQTTLAPAGSDLTMDFGYRNPALSDVTGSIYDDLDADGLDDGEPPLPGVTVVLVDPGPDGMVGTPDDIVLAETTTDPSGNYNFPDVPPGDYGVVVTDDDGTLDGYMLTGGLDAQPVTVGPGPAPSPADPVGYVRKPTDASIGDFVWLDSDSDGIQDPSETGMSGVRLLLKSPGPNGIPGDADDVILDEAITDLAGGYSFTGLPAGTYFVDVDGATVPTNITPTPGTTDPSGLITLSASEKFTEADFGYGSTFDSAIGDRLWYDGDGDGVQDPGELGIPGVDVKVQGPAGTFTTTTKPDGSWLIAGLTPGDYAVIPDSATLPPGYNPQPTNGASARLLDVPVGLDVMYADFGYAAPPGTTATLGDLIFIDANENGVQDPGEFGVPGVTVDLVSPGTDGLFDTPDDLTLATAVTNPDGNYDFVGVPPGTYRVEVTDTDGFLQGLNLNNGSNPSVPITVAGGDDRDDIDFAYVAGDGALGNQFWHDTNSNGVFDAGEPVFAGVTMDLWRDVNENGVIEPVLDNLIQSKASDNNGHYLFTGLPSGSWIVDVTDVSNVLDGFNKTSGTVGADNNSQPDPYHATLASSNLTADFGYVAAVPFTIGGIIFEDVDENGSFLQGLDARVPRIPVSLYRDLNGNGMLDADDALISQALSDGLGGYSFPGMPDGAYIVDVDPTGTRLRNHFQTTQGSTNGVQPVTINGQQPDPFDFGYRAMGGDQTNPVTIATFGSEIAGDVVRITWTTASEAANAGFDVYVETAAGETLRLNERLVPTASSDAFGPQDYVLEVPAAMLGEGADATRLWIEDVDLRGEARRHGPFSFGTTSGDELGLLPIDWPTISAEHAELGLVRTAEVAGDATARLDALRDELAAEGLDAAGLSDLAGDAGFDADGDLATDDGAMPIDAALAARFVDALTRADAGGALADVTVDRAGLVRVTHEELAATGVDLTGLPTALLAVTLDGRAVSRQIEGPALWSSDSALVFHGQARESIYGEDNVYRVSLDLDAAVGIAREDGTPAEGVAAEPWYLESIEVNDDLGYAPGAPGDDPWYAAQLLARGEPQEQTFALRVDGLVDTTDVPVVLRVDLWGVTDWPTNDADHHVELILNEVVVADEVFDGVVEHRVSVPLEPGLITEGGNALTVGLPGDTGERYDMVALDRYALTYPRAFEAREGGLTFTASGEVFEVRGLATDDVVVLRHRHGDVVRLSGVEVAAEDSDATSEAGAISESDGEVANGSTTYTARFAGTADAASYTVVERAALGAAKAVAPARRATAAELLAEEADYIAISHGSFVEGLDELVAAREAEGLTVRVVDVADVYAAYGDAQFGAEPIDAFVAEAYEQGTRYVLLVGGDTYDYRDRLGVGSMSFVPSPYGATGDLIRHAPLDPLYGDVDGDGVPEVAVGRFPVRTVAELEAVVGKTLAYGAKGYGRTAVFAADEIDRGVSYADASDGFVSGLPEDWRVERAYLDEAGVASARATLLQAIDEGVALVTYAGHSQADAWGFDGLFDGGDAAALENAGRPTVVTQWGCWNTYHVAPQYDTMGHRLLLSGDRGAAAVLGSATLSQSASDARLGGLVTPAMTEPGATLGAAVTAAKQELADTHPEDVDVILGWTLLGDPALVIEDAR